MFLHELFFYLTIVLLPTQLGLHFWPDRALVIGRRIDYLSPTLYLTDITIIATLLLWIGFPHKTVKKKSIAFSWKTFTLLCMALVYMLCNIYFSPSPLVVLFRWIKVMELSLFGYYIMQTKPSLQTTSLYLTIAMMYSSVIAIMQFIFQHSVGGILWYLGERTFDIATPGIARVNWCWLTTVNCMELLRSYGTFPHPNVLAGFLVVSLCLSLWQILSHPFKNTKIIIWYWLTIGVSGIALVLTFSRASWLIGIIGILTTLGIVYKKSIVQTATWIVISCFTCMIIAFPYFLSLIHQSESVSIRNELSRAALTMWKSYPLIGVGFNAFLVKLPTILPARYIFFLQPPHNVYLLLASELGSIGVIWVGWYVYRLLIMLLRHSNKLLLLMLFIYGAIGIVDHYPVTLQQGQLLTTIIITLGFLSK